MPKPFYNFLWCLFHSDMIKREETLPRACSIFFIKYVRVISEYTMMQDNYVYFNNFAIFTMGNHKCNKWVKMKKIKFSISKSAKIYDKIKSGNVRNIVWFHCFY